MVLFPFPLSLFALWRTSVIHKIVSVSPFFFLWGHMVVVWRHIWNSTVTKTRENREHPNRRSHLHHFSFCPYFKQNWRKLFGQESPLTLDKSYYWHFCVSTSTRLTYLRVYDSRDSTSDDSPSPCPPSSLTHVHGLLQASIGDQKVHVNVENMTIFYWRCRSVTWTGSVDSCNSSIMME